MKSPLKYTIHWHCVCVIPPTKICIYIYIYVYTYGSWMILLMLQKSGEPLEVGSSSYDLLGFLHPTGGWEWDFWTINCPCPTKTCWFSPFSHLRCHLSQFGFQGIATGVDFQLPVDGPVRDGKTPRVWRENDNEWKEKKSWTKCSETLTTPFLFLNQKRFKIIARFDLPTLFAGMVGIDSLYLFQIPQLTLSPHLSFSIQAQLVFSHLLPDPNIPCFEPACSA